MPVLCSYLDLQIPFIVIKHVTQVWTQKCLCTLITVNPSARFSLLPGFPYLCPDNHCHMTESHHSKVGHTWYIFIRSTGGLNKRKSITQATYFRWVGTPTELFYFDNGEVFPPSEYTQQVQLLSLTLEDRTFMDSPIQMKFQWIGKSVGSIRQT